MTMNEAIFSVGKYALEAARTFNPGLRCQDRLVNAALGLCGELAELSVADSVEEITNEAGDVLWYLNQAAHGLGILLSDVTAGPDFSTFDALVAEEVERGEHNYLSPGTVERRAARRAGAFADMVKKHVMHGKALDPAAVLGCLKTVLVCVSIRLILVRVPGGLAAVAGHNAHKLRMRYPDGFRRADAAEAPGACLCTPDPDRACPVHGGAS